MVNDTSHIRFLNSTVRLCWIRLNLQNVTKKSNIVTTVLIYYKAFPDSVVDVKIFILKQRVFSFRAEIVATYIRLFILGTTKLTNGK